MESRQLGYIVDQSVIIDLTDKLVDSNKQRRQLASEQSNIKNDMLTASEKEKRSLQREYNMLEREQNQLQKEIERLERQEERIYNGSSFRR